LKNAKIDFEAKNKYEWRLFMPSLLRDDKLAKNKTNEEKKHQVKTFTRTQFIGFA